MKRTVIWALMIALCLTITIASFCYLNALNHTCKVVEIYHGWLIIEVKEAYTMHPSGQKVSVFVAMNLNSSRAIFGIDVPDLKADVDEFER